MSDIQPIVSVPFYRKLWVVILLTALLFTFPVAMISLLTGPVYRWRDHAYRPIGNGPRYVYGGILVLWLAALVLRPILVPGALKDDWKQSADPDHPAATAVTNANKPSSSTSSIPSQPQQSPDAQATQETASQAAPVTTGGIQGPADEEQYFAQLKALNDKARAAGDGTRTYDETMQQIMQLNASLNGTVLRNWTCTIPPDGGASLSISKNVYCFGQADQGSQLELWFNDQSLITENMYAGDVLQFSGTAESQGVGSMRIYPTTAAIIKKSK